MTKNKTATLRLQIQKTIGRALQVSEAEITPDLTFGDLPQWDSMGHMEVMMSLEEQFGIEISADTIANLTSIPAIQEYLETNGHV